MELAAGALVLWLAYALIVFFVLPPVKKRKSPWK